MMSPRATAIPRLAAAGIALVRPARDDMDAHIAFGLARKHVVAQIAVVHDDQLEIGKGLAQHTADRGIEEPQIVIDRHDDGNARSHDRKCMSPAFVLSPRAKSSTAMRRAQAR